MRGPVRSLTLLALALAAMGAALPEPPPADDPLARNQQLLDEWRTNPKHYARLQRDLERFWSLPREERDRLRTLDRELNEQDSATQKRLWGVLERYHAWLGRLPESDRKRIEAASSEQRLAIIKEIREQQWVERLPELIRNELKAMPAGKRAERIVELKKEERQRIQEALKMHPPVRPRKDKPTKLSEFPPEVQLFFREQLNPLLTSQERETLKRAEGQPWPTYARTLSEFAGRHPIPLPGPVGPVRLSDLTGQMGKHLREGPRRDALQKVEGKWPEFGMALRRLPRYQEHPLPSRLTPSSPKDFSEPVQEFITLLEGKLSTEERDRLRAAENKWPDYPKLLLDLARKHKLDVPGMTLPGPRELWDNARAALPEVPDRTLFHFVMSELSAEDRQKLPLSSDDPVVREKVKKKFFEKHPRELRRLQQLDSRGIGVE
jgi:hypothetical protein